MRSPVRVAQQARALVAVSRTAADAYGCGPLRAARIARRVRRRQGFEHAEALRVGVLDPALTEAERAAFVSRDANLRAQAPLNGDNETPAITGDKTVFYRYCALLGIAVPEMFGILDSRASSWSASGRVMTGTRDIEAFVAEDLPARFVVKPSEGYAGRGVRLVERRDDGMLQVNGRTTSAAAFWSELRADDEFAVWIVQELLVNHPEMSAIGGSETLHTARITTFVGRAGPPAILFSNLKLAISGGAVDNFQAGATGNAICDIDHEGRLGAVYVTNPGPAGLQRRADNPLTGESLTGRALPGWDDARRMVLDAAPHFLPYRALGWDVALTPGGPVIVETNTRWLPLPYPPMRGIHQMMLDEGGRE
jgi:Sugar-transfer associated ATP-grasp